MADEIGFTAQIRCKEHGVSRAVCGSCSDETFQGEEFCISKLKEQNKDMLEALKLAQWGADDWCTACDSDASDGHEESCLVRKAIAKAEVKE